MVELDSLNSSPSRDDIDYSDPKSSTPTDKPTIKNGQENITPINPPPLRQAMSTRARPLFREEPLTYSTKKERPASIMLFRKPPPRPPAKSCPPKSRIFKNNDLYKAQKVSFLDSPNEQKQVLGTPLNPKVYNTNLKKSYFQQAFSIEAEIGAGYFGTVYKVRSKEDGQLYAIKIANEKYKGFSDRDSKLEEVRKHQFLPLHQNLVKFYESWEEEGRLYQQFELCDGNLGEFCEKNNNIPESLVWGYLVDLLQAVQHLHDHDLVHMDIKPDNIFFGFDGRCKLGDFGLIVDLIHETKSGYREGDSKYLAPEVLRGNISKSCDIFSLGITILELACDLDLPSKGTLWSELRERGPQNSLTLQLSPELRRVIQLMMIKDPERRPGVNQILELPSVAKAARRREREVMRRRYMEKLVKIVQPVLLLLTFILHTFESGFGKLFGWYRVSNKVHGDQTPPCQPLTSWDQDVYSDDENGSFKRQYHLASSEDDYDCSTASAESSLASELAAPLRDSSSSVSSDEKVSAPNFQKRNCFTSPARSRQRTVARTPQFLTRTGLRSPQKKLNFLSDVEDSSPYLGSSKTSSSTCRQRKTPQLVNVHMGEAEVQQDDEDEDIQLSIQPQCLAKTFDCFSDDE